MNLFYEKVREEITRDGLIYQKTVSLAETLVEMGMMYPVLDSQVSMDSITAENSRAMVKEMVKVGRRLAAKLSNKVEPESPSFVMHYEYKVNGVGGKEAIKYVPFTMTLADGQVLTALVRNTDDKKKYTPRSPMIVTKWALNKQDITNAIYMKGDNSIDVATTAARLKKIIEKSHIKFVKANPDAIRPKSAKKMADEIDNYGIDYDKVVWSADEASAAEGAEEEGTPEADETIAELKGQYDTATWAIDDEATRKAKDEKNAQIITRLEELGVPEEDMPKQEKRELPATEKPKGKKPKFYWTIRNEEGLYYQGADGFTKRKTMMQNEETAKELFKVAVDSNESASLYRTKEVWDAESESYKEDSTDLIDEFKAKGAGSEAKFAELQKEVAEALKSDDIEYLNEQYESLTDKYGESSDPMDSEEGSIEKELDKIMEKVGDLETDPDNITAENIAERYQNMDFDERFDNREVIGRTMEDRQKEIMNFLGVTFLEDDIFSVETAKEKDGNHLIVISQTVFGIKDNLEPIDEYIAKIKESDQYKSYIKEKEKNDLLDEFNEMVDQALSITDISDEDNETELATLFDRIQKHPIGLYKPAEDKKAHEEGVTKVGNHVNALIEARDEAGDGEGNEPTDAELIKQITENEVYKQVMKDSHGGVMYDVSNTYDAEEILDLWEKVHDKDAQDGIIRGAMDFLKEQQTDRVPDTGETMDYDFSKFDTITSSEEFENELDALAEQIEADGKMDDHEDQLNELADKLTELMKKENENA